MTQIDLENSAIEEFAAIQRRERLTLSVFALVAILGLLIALQTSSRARHVVESIIAEEHEWRDRIALITRLHEDLVQTQQLRRASAGTDDAVSTSALQEHARRTLSDLALLRASFPANHPADNPTAQRVLLLERALLAYHASVSIDTVALELEQSYADLQRQFIALHSGIWAEESEQYLAMRDEVDVQTRLLAIGVGLLVVMALATFVYGRLTLRMSRRLAAHTWQTTQELKRLSNHAQLASHAKTMFLANMSHEIRTPLNGVLGMADLLVDTPLTPKQRRFAVAIRDSGKALMSLLNDLLDLAKIEAGKVQIECTPFDVRSLVEDVIALHAEQAHRRGLALHCEVDPDLHTRVLGDSDRLRQVLVNLINNAIKFTERGKVTVTVAAAAQAPEAVASVPSAIAFVVQDTGIGVPVEVQERIFAAFTQVDRSARKYGGTGLGLSISQRLVELMGGVIRLQSDGRNGSRFSFELSMVPAPEEPIAPQAKALRVLVLDDNLPRRQLVERWITSWGHRCMLREARQLARECLQAISAQDERPDVILLDYDLLGSASHDLLASMNATGRMPRLVLLSSLGEDFSAERRAQLGIEAVLYKPLRQRELQAALQPNTAAGETAQIRFAGRVLVAEDNPVNQELTQAMLEVVGMECVVAANGAAALALWRAAVAEGRGFDLLLLDVRMPVMDGHTMAREVRAAEQAAGLPPTTLVALTANASPADRSAALAAGMDDFLTKPLLQSQLNQLLGRWLTARA